MATDYPLLRSVADLLGSLSGALTAVGGLLWSIARFMRAKRSGWSWSGPDSRGSSGVSSRGSQGGGGTPPVETKSPPPGNP